MKNKIIWIIILLSLLVGYIFFQKLKIDKLREQTQLQSIELSTLQDSVLVHRTKIGQLTSKIDVIEVDKNNLKKSLEVMGFNLKELKEREIKWKKVEIALRSELKAQGTGSTTVIDTMIVEKTDTVFYSMFNYNDEHITFNGNIIDKKLDFNYQYRVGIDFLLEPKRKSTIVNVILDDPNASITTATSIKVTNKKTFFERPIVWGAAGFIGGFLIAK